MALLLRYLQELRVRQGELQTFAQEYATSHRAFAQVHNDQVACHELQIVFVDEKNRQTELHHHVPTQQ